MKNCTISVRNFHIFLNMILQNKTKQKQKQNKKAVWFSLQNLLKVLQS